MKYLSLFSGIGGFELGLENSDYDFECIGWSEIDRYAKAIYSRWFPRHKYLGDASEIDPNRLQDFDLLVGGFPCQAFSIGGKREGFDDCRGTLFFEIARICAVKKPRYLLLENVKGLLSHDKGRTFKKMLGVLSELGYDVEWQINNSKSFGTAQNRERLYLKGYFRAKCGGEILSSKGVGRQVTESNRKIETIVDGNQAVRIRSVNGISSTLIGLGGGQGGKTGLYAVPTMKSVKFNRKVKKRVNETDLDQLRDWLRMWKEKSNLSINEISEKLDRPRSEVEHWFRKDEYFAPPSDEIWDALKSLLDITDDKYDKYITEFEWVDGVFESDKRAYDESGLAPTVTTTETLAKINVVGNLSNTGHKGADVLGTDGISSTLTASNHKHSLKILEDFCIRRLTPTECERLQAFPDGWTEYGADGERISDTQRYKCLGNAVTTTVVTHIANEMFYGKES